MDVVDSLRPDSILEETNHLEAETPRQDPQRTCTRNLPCLQWGCMICNTPINHVRNLDLALNTDHGPQASPIPTDHQPPPNHTILFLTTSFQLAIQENDIAEITAINKLYSQTLKSNLGRIFDSDVHELVVEGGHHLHGEAPHDVLDQVWSEGDIEEVFHIVELLDNL